jgi:hypothetical protein
VAFVTGTVKVDEVPAMTTAGFAPMLTVGAGYTVTVVLDETVPPNPVAVAVYVVVAVGVTDCAPPVAEREY